MCFRLQNICQLNAKINHLDSAASITDSLFGIGGNDYLLWRPDANDASRKSRRWRVT
jgi:hypothetical protein